MRSELGAKPQLLLRNAEFAPHNSELRIMGDRGQDRKSRYADGGICINAFTNYPDREIMPMMAAFPDHD